MKRISYKNYFIFTLALIMLVLGLGFPRQKHVRAALTTYSAYAPGAVAQPSKGGSYNDPVFGTKIIRITDGNDGSTANIAYSYWPAFNYNSTKLIVALDWNPVLY